MKKTLQQRFAPSIARVTNGPFSTSTACRVIEDSEEVLKQLSRGGTLAARASTIISTALALGFPDVVAVHCGVIAAPESNYDPKAEHPDTHTKGYFQLHPDHWSTSAHTTSIPILKAQLLQMKKQHGFKVMSDLAVFYGAHFYPGLGRAYSKSRVLGVQPGKSTFGQYAFTDRFGSVFHSPLIMAVYAHELFLQYTGAQTTLDVPQLPAVVVQTNLGGGTAIRSAGLEGPIGPIVKSRFVIAPNAPVATVTFLDTATNDSYSDSKSPDFSRVEWAYSKDVVSVYVSDDPVPLRSDAVNPLFSRFEPEKMILASPMNLIAPAVDTLIQRIRDESVDFEILKANIYDIVIESGRFGSRMERDDNGRLKESKGSIRLRSYFEADSDFKEFLLKMSVTELASVLQSLLFSQLEGSSLTCLTDQLAMHEQIFMLSEVAGSESEDFPDQWATSWVSYSGVLFPMSLLVTPAFGTLRVPEPLMISQNFAQSLFKWTRTVIGSPGEEVLLSAVASIMPSSSSSSSTARKPRRQ